MSLHHCSYIKKNVSQSRLHLHWNNFPTDEMYGILEVTANFNPCWAIEQHQQFSYFAYPTVIRNMGFGTVNGVGRMVGATIPLVVSVLRDGDDVFLFRVISVITGILVWIFPETKGLALLDSLQDGEEYNKTCGGIPFGSRSDIQPEYQNNDLLIKTKT